MQSTWVVKSCCRGRQRLEIQCKGFRPLTSHWLHCSSNRINGYCILFTISIGKCIYNVTILFLNLDAIVDYGGIIPFQLLLYMEILCSLLKVIPKLCAVSPSFAARLAQKNEYWQQAQPTNASHYICNS